MSNNEKMYKDLIAFHPGAYVAEIIEDFNITQQEFAQRLGVSAKTISKLVNGEESISVETANKLDKLTGVSIATWLNLQTSYDIKLLEIKESQNNDEEELCGIIDFKYFKENKFVEDKVYKAKEKIIELRKLFQVSNLSYLYNFNNLVSYRNTRGFSEKSIVNSNIMLELAINLSKNKTNNKFNKNKLEKILPELRAMTLQEPKDFYSNLKDMLLDCGIIFCGLPALKNANLNGATKKFKNGSILLLMTDRNKGSDIFWFSLFHELGHILNNDFYSDHENSDAYKDKEDKADQFAQELLIPKVEYLKFKQKNIYTKDEIMRFSEKIHIHPSIVVGRLQKEGEIEYNAYYNSFKVKYNIVLNK